MFHGKDFHYWFYYLDLYIRFLVTRLYNFFLLVSSTDGSKKGSTNVFTTRGGVLGMARCGARYRCTFGPSGPAQARKGSYCLNFGSARPV
jgi:hypothetical protein